MEANKQLPQVNDTLSASYIHCKYVARTQARNFYYSFLTLPQDRRDAMCAVYAFMRYSDDVSDEAGEEEAKARRMRNWREALVRALKGDYGDSLILPAFHDVIMKYGIPEQYLFDLIDGTEADLTVNRYATFEELYQYCYRVASVVGFVCIHVWGFDRANGKALEYAEACGLAFQLTNILRDVKEDAERDRIYLPLEDLKRFGLTEEDLKNGVVNNNFRTMMRFQAERAKTYYQQAKLLMPLLDPAGRPTYAIMLKIYRGLLSRIERSRYDVHTRRIRISAARKISILAGAWLRSRVSHLNLRRRSRRSNSR